MQDLEITNIGTWSRDLEGQVFRYLTYKKNWTPYEMDKKYSDESEFEEGGYYRFAYITNVIEIPGDVLIEFTELSQGDFEGQFEDAGFKQYRRLSEIKLERFDIDNGEGE